MKVNQGVILRDTLEKYDISVSEIVKNVGISKQSVYNFFGQDRIKPDTLDKVVNFLSNKIPNFDSRIFDYYQEEKPQVQSDISFYQTIIDEKDKRIEELKTMLEKSNSTIDFFQRLVLSNLEDIKGKLGKYEGSNAKPEVTKQVTMVTAPLRNVA